MTVGINVPLRNSYTSIQEESEICQICKGKIDVFQTSHSCHICQKRFHLNHLQTWLKYNTKCPVCLSHLQIHNRDSLIAALPNWVDQSRFKINDKRTLINPNMPTYYQDLNNTGKLHQNRRSSNKKAGMWTSVKGKRSVLRWTYVGFAIVYLWSVLYSGLTWFMITLKNRFTKGDLLTEGQELMLVILLLVIWHVPLIFYPPVMDDRAKNKPRDHTI